MSIPTVAPVRLTWGKPRNQPDAPDQLLISGFAEPIATITQLLRAGEPQMHAQQQIGVANRTWHRWKKRGEEALDVDDTHPRERPFREFYRLVSTASAEGLSARLLTVAHAATAHDENETITETKPVTVRTYNDQGKVVSEAIEMHTTTRTIRRVGVYDWKAAQWLLEVGMPAIYGRAAQRVEVTGPDGAPIEVDRDAAMAEFLRQVDELEERRNRKTG